MSDQLPEDLMKMLFPDSSDTTETSAEGDPNDLLAEGLKLAAGQGGSPIMSAIEELLAGKGDLLGVAAEALSTKGGSATEMIASFIAKKFHISEELAAMIAGLVVQFVSNLMTKGGTTAGLSQGSLGMLPTSVSPTRTPTRTPTRQPTATRKSKGKSLRSK